MTYALSGLLTMCMLTSGLGDGDPIELRYDGTLAPIERGDVGEVVREFEATYLLTSSKSSGKELAFVVHEIGGGSVRPWPERFGRLSLDSNNKSTGRPFPALLYELKGIPYSINLRRPLSAYSDKFKPKAQWTDGRRKYSVIGSRTIDKRDCWTIKVQTKFGKTEVLDVDKKTALIVAAERRFVIGQGDWFLLKTKLRSAKTINDQRLQQIEKPLHSLLKLQKKLNRAPHETKSDLNSAQLAEVVAVIKTISETAEGTLLAKLTKEISRDVNSQQKRKDDVGTLAGKFVGKQAPSIKLTSLTGRMIDKKEYTKKIVVLHFWKYRRKPLIEPYGQVAYLDFLNEKRRKLGVKIFGVAVDSRFAGKEGARRAASSVRSLKQFMNLGYPITADDETLLGKFGDPRELGAKLPLWVVIAPDGKVVHYHAGLYDINPDEGLRQLQSVIDMQIRKQRAKKKNRPTEKKNAEKKNAVKKNAEKKNAEKKNAEKKNSEKKNAVGNKS